MDLLACGETEQNLRNFRLFTHSVLKIESCSEPDILLKAWKYIGEQK